MSEWEDFRTKCPSCDNNKIISWEHCKGYCEKINKNAEIKCYNPNCPNYLHPKFIMGITFDCGQHGGKYLAPNGTNVWAALGMISLIANLSKEDRTKLFMRINGYNE